MEQFLMRQFDAQGVCIDHSLWVCEPFELHVLMFDVRIVGCVKFDVFSLNPSAAR